jgi:hypothetical protein
VTKIGLAGIGMAVTLGATSVALGAGEKAQVTGEVIDTFCYATMGAKGAAHKTCGIDCAKKGIPVGLLEKGTDKVYVLLPSKDKEPVPDAVVQKMGETVTITGEKHASGGETFLTVESVK